jgi:hypothetical protein
MDRPDVGKKPSSWPATSWSALAVFWAVLAALYATDALGSTTARGLIGFVLIGLIGTVMAFLRYWWLRRQAEEPPSQSVFGSGCDPPTRNP